MLNLQNCPGQKIDVPTTYIALLREPTSIQCFKSQRTFETIAMRQKIAIIGSGISGLGSAYLLAEHHDVTVYETDSRLGGHSHTVDITLEGQTFGVDTGFLVFNRRTYPLLCRLFSHLGVPIAESDMSFSVQISKHKLEWAGTNLDSVFAQRKNLFRWSFWSMLYDIARFNRQSILDLDKPALAQLTLGQYLDKKGYGKAFRNDYLLPMAAAIWSCPTAQMMDYPFNTFVRFCANHGLLQITDRPTWMTVRGGSRVYVEMLARVIRASGGRIESGNPVTHIQRHADYVVVQTAKGAQRFDQLIVACHSDQALTLLGDDATPFEKEALGHIKYQANRAVLHTDVTLLPANRKVWSSWNYASGGEPTLNERQDVPVAVSYLLNRLQPLPTDTPVIVSLNPWKEPNPDLIHQVIHYAHPVFDGPAVRAQAEIKARCGECRTFYAGAWLGYGFHEDGFASAVQAVSKLAPLPAWLEPDVSISLNTSGTPELSVAPA